MSAERKCRYSGLATSLISLTRALRLWLGVNVTVTASAAFALYACGSGTTVKVPKGVDLVVLSPLALPLIAVNGPPVSASGPELTWAAGGACVPAAGSADTTPAKAKPITAIAITSTAIHRLFRSISVIGPSPARFSEIRRRYAGWEVQPNLS